MKVLVIASAFRPYSTGGADVAVENTVDGLLAHGHEVVVLTAGYASLRALWPKPESIPVNSGSLTVYRYFPLNLFSFLTINQRPAWLRLPWHGLDMFSFHAYLVTAKLLRIIQPDVVLTHNLKGVGYTSILAVERYVRTHRCRHIHTLHDVQLAIPSGRIIQGEEHAWQNTFWFTRWYGALCRKLFASPQVVVSASQFLLDFYVTRGFFPHSKQVVLLNPLQPRAPANFLPDPHGPLRLLYLGQLERHKGIIFLLRVFINLVSERPGVARLMVVGGGALLSEVRKLARDCPEVIVRGLVAHDVLPQVFSNIDATVFPSLCYENSPTIIGESLSFGVPVVAAQIGGVQLVRHGENGYTFAPGDETDLRRVLDYCLSNRSELYGLRPHTVTSVKDLDIDSYLTHLLNL